MIGKQAKGNGSVTIDSSTLTTEGGDLVAAEAGKGTLTLINGSASNVNTELSKQKGSTGTINLQNASTFTASGDIEAGAGTSQINIGNVIITPHGKFGYHCSFGANQSYTHVGFEALGGGNTGIDPSIVGVPWCRIRRSRSWALMSIQPII